MQISGIHSLQLLLVASGVWRQVQNSVNVEEDGPNERLDKLTTLQILAQNMGPLQTEWDLDQLDDDDSRVSGLLSGTGSSSDDDNTDGRQAVDGAEDEHSFLGVRALEAFYDFCALQGQGVEDSEAAQNKVQLLTMHASKGKEFPCVALMHVYQGRVPLIHRDDVVLAVDEREQERNLLYVGMTRAQDHLLVSWSETVDSCVDDPKKLEVSELLGPLLRHHAEHRIQGVIYHRLH